MTFGTGLPRALISRGLAGMALVLACSLLSAVPAPGTHRAAAATASPGLTDLSDVSCPTARVCYAVGYAGVTGPGGAEATDDGGRTWHVLPLRSAWGLLGISCPTATTCYSVGYAHTILRTTNGGRSWVPATTRNASAQVLRRVSCATAQMCVATGIAPSDAQGAVSLLVHRFEVTADGGRHWSYPRTPLDATNYALAAIACPTTRTCYAAGNQNTILISRDGGHSWHQAHSAGSGGIRTFLAIACHGERTCVAVGLDIGAPNSMLLVRTDNGGVTWTSQAAMVYPHVTFETWISGLAGVACPTVRACFIAAGDGTVLRTADGGRTWSVFAQTNHEITSMACPTVRMCVVVGSFGYIAVLPRDASMLPTPVPTSIAQAPTPVSQHSSTPTPPPAATPLPPTSAPSACSAWTIGGTWTFVAAAGAPIGSGSGTVNLAQSGSTYSGTLQMGGVSWTIQAVVQGTTVSLTWSAPGQVAQTDQGLISTDGTSIAANFGTFTGHAQCAR